MLNAIPEPKPDFDDPDIGTYPSAVPTQNADPEEAALEAREMNKYLLAKSLFDCREFDRCAAVFVPDSMLASIVSPKDAASAAESRARGKAAAAAPKAATGTALPRISQRSLFLALYAKYLSGEKRKDEDSEMVMGPQDLGACVNKQLLSISGYLEAWFDARKTEDGEDADSQGWLEYL